MVTPTVLSGDRPEQRIRSRCASEPATVLQNRHRKRYRMASIMVILSGVLVTGACHDTGSKTGPNPSGDQRPRVYGKTLSVELPGEPAATIRTSLPEDGASPLKREIEKRLGDIIVDPRLNRAALAHAEATEDSSVELPMSFTEFVIHWAGCPDPTAAVSELLTDDDSDEVLLQHLEKTLEGENFTHLGTARVESRGAYRWRWNTILVNRSCLMKAVPSTVDPGSSIPIMFRIDPRFESATLHATQPDGQIDSIPVGLSKTWAVTSVRASRQKGAMWIELLANSAKGPEVLVLFPVQIGRPPVQKWVGTTNPDESWISDPVQAAEHMVALVNRDRTNNGLPILSVDPRLSAIAREHSTDMLEEDFFAHVSPSTGDISDRLRQHGYFATLAMENLARSPTLGEAEVGLMKSPGHRAAILSEEVTHLGVGVVRDNSDPPMYIVTQIFAKPIFVASTRDFLGAFEERIREHRQSFLLDTLIDSRLSQAAQAVAESLARDGLENAQLKAVVEPELAQVNLDKNAWRVAAGTATSIDDIKMPRCAEMTEMQTFGLGAANSRTRDGTPFVTFVVLVMK